MFCPSRTLENSPNPYYQFLRVRVGLGLYLVLASTLNLLVAKLKPGLGRLGHCVHSGEHIQPERSSEG